MRRTALISARTAKGWTQAEVARRLRISLSHYQKLEEGQRNPGVHLAEAINALLGERVVSASRKHRGCGAEGGDPQ